MCRRHRPRESEASIPDNTDGSTNGHVLQASLMSALFLFEIREETLRGEERPHEQSPSTVEENEKVPSP